jgi:hypothetical protein
MAKRGTTKSDVPNVDDHDDDAPEPMVIHRLPRPGFADVIEAREKKFSDETGETPEDPENLDEGAAYANAPDGEDEAPAAEPAPEVKPEPAPTAETPPAPAPAPTDEEMIELTVDGEKVKRPKSELPSPEQALQMKIAADKKFQDAARLRKEAEDLSTRREQPAPVERAPQAPPPVPEPAPTPSVDLDSLRKTVAEKRAAFLQASLYSDEPEQGQKLAEYDEAQRKLMLEEVRAEITTQTPPVREFARQVKQEIDESQLREKAETIRTRFLKDFEDVASDPHLYQIAAAQVNREIASGADGMDYATYEKVGQQVRQWIGGTPPAAAAPTAPAAPAAPAATPQDPTLQARADRKRQVPPVPTANQRAGSDAEEPDEDISTTVRELARRRVGQS